MQSFREAERRRGRSSYAAVKAVAKAGSDDIVFDKIRLPTSGPLPSRADHPGFVTKISSLTAVPAADGGGNVTYAAEMSVSYRQPSDALYQSALTKPFDVGQTHTQLAETLDAFRQRVVNHFPDLRAVPLLEMRDRGDQVLWSAVLPPFTTVTTDSPHLFNLMGFDDAVELSTAADREVSALVNYSPQTMILKARPQLMGDTLDARYRTVVEDATPLPPELEGVLLLEEEEEEEAVLQPQAVIPLPDRVYLTVHVLTDWLPQTLSTKKTLTVREAAQSLALIVSNGLALLNLKPEVLKVTQDQGGVRIVNHHLATSRLTVHLLFPDRVALFLGQQTLSFPLNDKRSVLLKPDEHRATDPLLPLLPLMLVSADGGSGGRGGDSYVQGVGWCNVVALMTGVNKFRGQGSLVLRGDAQHLRLILLDKTLRRVTFQEDTRFYLTLKLLQPPPL